MTERQESKDYSRTLEALRRAQERWSGMSATATKTDREWARKSFRRLQQDVRNAEKLLR